MPSHLISVAIDIGTTFSGYAYSDVSQYKSDPTRIFTEKWSTEASCVPGKTLTCLLLDKDKQFHAFGYEAQDIYSELAEDQEHKEWYYFTKFKMKLYNLQKQNFKDLMIKDEGGKSVNAYTVFSESIRYIKKHCIQRLTNHGKIVSIDEIRWVLTVPAIWTDTAKRFMRDSAVMAGIDNDKLILALEPEAASLYCMYEKTDRCEDTLISILPGTTYMVVDIGGGTTDITVHEKIDEHRVKEIHQATGGPWGGTTVDELFLHLMGQIYKEEVMECFRIRHLSDYLSLTKTFEVAKRGFTASKRFFRVPTAVSLNKVCEEETGMKPSELMLKTTSNLKNEVEVLSDKLKIESRVMTKIFETVTRKIVSLIETILKDLKHVNISTILVIGGYSDCVSLQNAIKENFVSEERKVFIPENASECVLKGAVIFGHDSTQIKSRMARYTYGTVTKTRFIEGQHREDHILLVNGVICCGRLFSPFITAGTSIEAGHTISKTYHTDNLKKTKKFKIYASENPNVQYVDEPSCSLLCKIPVGKYFSSLIGQRCDITVKYVFGETELQINVECEQIPDIIEASCNLTSSVDK